MQRGFSPSELAEQVDAERRGVAYLLYRDGRSVQRLLELPGPPVTIGRQPGLDLVAEWDPEISRVHARLERVGERWTVVDDGLSRNGTFVNGARVQGRRRLGDRDVLRFGHTEVVFRDPAEVPADTLPTRGAAGAIAITDAQRQVLEALCRPLLAAEGVAAPASNREIAESLHLSVEAVRTHMKSLFQRFDVPDLPQNRKRAELARRALATGMIAR